MPKTNFCKDPKKELMEKREKAVREMISGKMGALDMSNSELARKTGMNPRTLYSRRNNPGEVRLSELWAIIDVLKPEGFYLEKII